MALNGATAGAVCHQSSKGWVALGGTISGSPTRKYSVDEWLLNRPNEDTRNMLLELMERRYSHVSTVFCTQYPLKDWHHRLGGRVHADAIMDRITHNADWIETGDFNMRERSTRTQP